MPDQISGEDVDFLVDTNLKATIFTSQAAYAVMRKDGGGRIIDFGSGEAVRGSPISALYAPTKGVVAAWTPAIARAWAAEKISAISLGGAHGDPVDDLGPAMVFLCSEGSRLMTGQLIAVDGSLVMLGA